MPRKGRSYVVDAMGIQTGPMNGFEMVRFLRKAGIVISDTSLYQMKPEREKKLPDWHVPGIPLNSFTVKCLK